MTEARPIRTGAWPGIATAVAITWIFSNILWLGVAGPIWKAVNSSSPDAWIGFAGNALGASVSLLAAIVAGIAAYKTIIPMQRQLGELARQNQFAQYERLRSRAAELNDELRLVYRVNADLEIVERMLDASGLGARERLSDAIDRLMQGVDSLWTVNRTVWGDTAAQKHRKEYVEKCLLAVSASLKLRQNTQMKAEWLQSKTSAWTAGVVVHARIQLELQILSDEIARMEPSILGRPADFPIPAMLQATE
jgi:hypothetical protein